MARVSPKLTSFTTGEVSPLAQARTDVDALKNGVSLLQRYIPTIQGGATKCPGTKYIGSAASVSASNILDGYTVVIVEFEFSNTQAYIIEFNMQTAVIRFYKNRAQILSGGTPYQIQNPYSLFIGSRPIILDCQFFQSNDVLFITHPNQPTRKLIRLADDNWRLETIAFEDGPYLPIVFPSTPHPAIQTVGSAAQFGTTTVQSFLSLITSVASQTASTYRVTTSSPHFLPTGDRTAIDGVVGTTLLQDSVNNFYGLRAFHTVASVSSVTFDIPGNTGTITNGYASAGSVYWSAFGGFDDGRMIRIKQSASPNQWVWGTLSRNGSLSHSGKYNMVIQGTNSLNAGTQSEFRLGIWRLSGDNGSFSSSSFPATATIHERRLSFYGAPLDPARLDMSHIDDYENFAPTPPDDTSVPDDYAISTQLASNGVQVGVWIASDEKGLLAGSMGQEWMVRPSYQQEALSPTNITQKPTSDFGAVGGIGAVKIGKSVLFVQRAGRKVMEYSYYYDVDGFDCEDVTVIGEHISQSGIRKLIHQKQPQPILWALRNDGVLIGMTYKKSKDLATFGWHRHPVGGYSNANGDPAKVVSIACIPTPDGTSEELYLVVQRWINGQTVFQVEYMTQPFDDSINIEDAFFVDSGLTYDPGLSISSISSVATNSVLVGISSHGYSNGDRLRANGIVGLPGLNYVGSVNNDYLVSAASTNTFIIQTTGTVNVAYGTLSSSGSYSYISNGSFSKYANTVSGLGHLEGQVVNVFGNGAILSNATVTGSAVTMSSSCSKAHIGLNYVSRIKTLRFDAGAADGTSLGKLQRSSGVSLILDNQGIGLKMGRDFDNLLDVEFDAEDQPLFSGVKNQSFEDDYTRDNRICLEHSQPTPSTILAILPELVTQDAG